MSYHIEGGDIVIDGFEKAIADSPYSGISDMRCIDPVSIPGEAPVGFSTVNPQPSVTSAIFTAVASTDTITWNGIPSAGTVGNQLAITVSNSGGALPSGLTANTTYYIISSTATTFKLAATPGGSAIDLTTNGSGVNTFSSVTLGRPTYMTSYVSPINSYFYFMIDKSSQAWWWNGVFWVFLNNDTTDIFAAGQGIAAWNGYLFVFTSNDIDYLPIPSLQTAAWTSDWKDTTFSPIHQTLVGSTDEVLYFCNATTIGSILKIAGMTFDPSNPATYFFNAKALQLPSWETAQCLGQLQTNILAGGIKNVIYNWDRISLGYIPIFIGENLTSRIVGVNTNAYLFSGNRGKIYITNGSQAQLFKKVPDHLANTINPIFTWFDATYSRNQLYFGVQVLDNAGNTVNNYGGLWAIDLDTEAQRIALELSYGNYSGGPTAILPFLASQPELTGNPGLGLGLFIGWMNTINSEIDGVDSTVAIPYIGGQSYVDSDLIPVGTILDPFTPTQIEWKTSVPIGVNGSSETIALYYMVNQADTPHLIGTTTSSTGLLSGGGTALSDVYQSNFEKIQWLKIRAVLTSNATTPTFNRLKQIRIRNYPSGNQPVVIAAYQQTT